MGKPHKTATAHEDLVEIWCYHAERDVAVADRYARRFDRLFDRLAAMPYIGRDRSDLRPRMRTVVVWPYIVYFRPREDGVEILRVLHGARNVTDAFEFGGEDF